MEFMGLSPLMEVSAAIFTILARILEKGIAWRSFSRLEQGSLLASESNRW
jgi:hypothetical protein